MFFDFNLASDAPGWADSRMQIGDVVLDMTASYLSDALGELLEALMLLVNGSPTASCDWTQEPGGWWWNFSRPDEAHVDVVIAFKDDAISAPWLSVHDGQVRLEARVLLTAFVEAINAGARRSLDEWGLVGYAKQWDMHPFPRMQLEALERWLREQATAPLYAWE